MFEISLNLLEQNVRKNHYSSMRIDDVQCLSQNLNGHGPDQVLELSYHT
jgi:hypothetical protein